MLIKKEILKTYTPSGMSALLNPLVALWSAKCESLDAKKSLTYEIKPYSYFELHDWSEGWNKMFTQNQRLIRKFDATKDNQTVPDVVYTDNNPCVTDDKPLY